MAFSWVPSIVLLCCLLCPSLFAISPTPQDPGVIVQEVHSKLNESRRKLEEYGQSCLTGNPIDDCWRCDPNWEQNRFRLADCAIGFGKKAIGGRDGRIYVVTDSSDIDAVYPTPGTLRHAVIQEEALWIIFKEDMTIQLKEELIMNSFKTLDGRGANVEITGAGITIQDVSNIIIHGLTIHDTVPTGNAMVRSSPSHYGWRTMADGDAVSIFGGSNVWVDHCTLYHCADGLVDAVMGSTAITISNNYFSHHDEVMLLGHSDSHYQDKNMQVTIAFNHFGEELNQRMPRCRHGYFHVVNNDYTHWRIYAIGGSANPTIFSQGNRFTALDSLDDKEVTKRMNSQGNDWKSWNWRSEGDLMINGAYFTPSGSRSSSTYSKASSLGARPPSLVPILTNHAGALNCKSTSSHANITANINSIPMLNGSNFKLWRENLLIVLGVMDLDLAIRTDSPSPLTADSTSNEMRDMERWERSNRMCIMIMKKAIPEAFRGTISENITKAKDFLADIEKRFVKNEKSEIGTLLTNLISMKYTGHGNVREYIMEMSHLASKLRALKLGLSEDLLVHLVLISLPAQFNQFKVSYNCQKETWSLNELISHCVQEEERKKHDKTYSAHLASTSKGKGIKRKSAVAAITAPPKKHDKDPSESDNKGCFFCGAEGHIKKHCSNYHAWRAKKGHPPLSKAK
ncbi:hypothetical protein CASFOL_001202 [Castilleja foliolosa]|uniref:Pectate lyase n=1 Tax=Castilleja foliolosa TaxID=1961234 RepID=A0ABD3EMF0_9LAMI